MKEEEPLFVLIQSLQKAEKRYFKTFTSQQKGDKIYLKLFDAIEKQKIYNEEKIFRKFLKEKFIRRFPATKKYLYNLILKSLRNYNSETSPDVQLASLFQNATLLYQRTLYEQAKKIIIQAERIALEYENFHFLIMLKELDANVTLAWRTTTEYDDYRKVMKSRQEIFRKLQNIEQYRDIQYKLLPFYSYQAIRDAGTKSKYEVAMNDPLLQNENKAISIRSKLAFHYLHGRYHFYIHEPEKAYIHFQKRAELVRSLKAKKWRATYVDVLHALMNACIRTMRHKELEGLIKEMRSLQTNSPDRINIYIFETSYNMEILLYIETGNAKKVFPLIPALEEGIKKWGHKIRSGALISFYYSITYAYFETGNFKQAAKWINRLLNSVQSDSKEDNLCFIRIINILVHYELGNEEYLKHSILSTYRFLTKRDRLYRFEGIVMTFIKKLPAAKDKNPISLFKTLHKELSQIVKDPLEKIAMHYFPFFSWLESKIQGRPFAEIVREKNAG